MDTVNHGVFYPLLAGTHQTRVLHLDSAERNVPLSGRLERIDLREGVSYDAISYEWGSPEKKQSIRLDNGATVYITESLHHALQDIRNEGPSQGSKTLWADGICINQEDLEERQQQVSMMGDIYSNAARVVTYVGPEKDGSSSAIDFAYELWHHVSLQIGAADPRILSVETLSDIGLPPASDPRWAALKAFCLRGWSGRCWCAQEFLLNENLILMCGRRLVEDWSLPMRIVQAVFNRSLPMIILPYPLEDPGCLTECLTSLGYLRHQIVDRRQRFNLLSLLSSLHAFQATDPRDKIYSVLSLADDRRILALPVDYNLPSEQLYITVAKRVLAQQPSLKILYSNLGKKTLSLPSWVPDWSTWQYGSHGTAVDGYYSACGSTTSELRLSLVENGLDIVGCLVDKITRLSERIERFYKSREQLEQYAERSIWLKEQMHLVQQLHPYPNGANIDDVFWRTLIGNLAFTKSKANDEYKAFFEAHFSLHRESSAPQRDMAREFCDAVRRRGRYRRLAITGMGYFGAIPEIAQIGDWVCMFNGGRHLFVVRPSGAHFTYIGHAYVHGLMSGEVLEADWYKERTITLI